MTELVLAVSFSEPVSNSVKVFWKNVQRNFLAKSVSDDVDPRVTTSGGHVTMITFYGAGCRTMAVQTLPWKGEILQDQVTGVS